MTKNKKIIQITLVSIGLFLIIATYFLYPTLNKDRLKKSVIENEIVNKADDQEDDDKDSSFENVEYKGFYNFDKPFTILSRKADISAKDPDIVYMKDLKVTLNLGNRTVLMFADEGVYNKQTNDLSMSKNVRATDGKTEILSENLDLLASKDYATIYNDVKMESENGSLKADKVEYNFEAKYYKISMFKDEKVKIKITQ